MFDLSLDRRGRQGDALGLIKIGEFHKEFLVDLSHWGAVDYWTSWRRTAARLLEYGVGRFAVSVGTPSTLYDTWGCWEKDGAVALFRNALPPSMTAHFTAAIDCENLPTDANERGVIEPGVDYYWCSLSDIADFERRLRGQETQ